MNIPGRIFLDTNVVNFSLDWREAIFDGAEIPEHIGERDRRDVQAMRGLFLSGRRAGWQLAISPKTYEEIMQTSDLDRRASLERWFSELWLYWREFFMQDGLHDRDAESLANRLGHSQFLAAFSDPPDRKLICHAIAYVCDAFCTRDWRSILRHRNELNGLAPLRLLTPSEWWEMVRPYAALWL